MRTNNAADPVLALHAVADKDTARVGRKAAALGALTRAGLAVPEGLVITAGAVDTGLDAALARIGDHFGTATLAVRSSALAEDAADASFAGQFDTILGVRGADQLRGAVLRCLAAARAERVRRYLGSRGPGPEPIAVLVQRQVDPDVAGVAFTANPVSGARDEVLVSAVPGLADALAAGTETPDEWVVTGRGARAVRLAHRALTEEQAYAVAELALRVQALRGGPQDVEWAMAGGRLLVLQARPITALPCPPVIDLPPGTWVKETARYPEPMTALGASLAAPAVSAGLSQMFATFGGLIEQVQAQLIGGEAYVRMVPVGGRDGAPPPRWLLAVAARTVPALRRRMRAARRSVRPEVFDALVARWDTEWAPQFERATATLRGVDTAALSDEDLDAHLGQALDQLRQQLSVHFQLTAPYVVPVHALVRTCAGLLGWDTQTALGLLTGTSTATAQPGAALAALAARIRAHPGAAAVVTDGQPDVAGRLREAAPELGAAFADWITGYGMRCINDDPGSPVLAERPWLVDALLRDAVNAGPPTAAGPGGEALLARARTQLASHSVAERDRFEAALSAARRSYPVREQSTFILSGIAGVLRLAALEAGSRLVRRGLIDTAADAVQLDIDTLRGALTGPVERDLRAIAARAKAERAWVAAHPGPAFHGPPPTPPPDLRGLPAPARRINQAMLWAQGALALPAPEHAPTTGTVLSGAPGSPGRYTGPVRLLRGAADFGKLRPGDVLACPTTDPAWSVLFRTAAALVTDGGGVLSHPAIVAREHGIPAVLGTGSATRRLHDGDIVTVDGTAGQVHLHHATSR